MCLSKCFGDHHENRDAGPGIAAERGSAVRDDAVALATRLCTRAERHGVEVRGKEKPRSRPCSGQVHDQIACFGRQRNTLVGVVETNGRFRNADLLQSVADCSGNIGFLSGYALDREKPHQVVFSRRDVEGNRVVAHDIHPII